MLFNKQVSGNRIDEVLSNLPSFTPDFTNYNEIKDKLKTESVKSLNKDNAYLSMPKDMIDYLKSLPEFNAEIFKKITGIKTSSHKIIIDGKEIELSEESFNALKESLK